MIENYGEFTFMGELYTISDEEISFFNEGFFISAHPDKRVIGWHGKKKFYSVKKVDRTFRERYEAIKGIPGNVNAIGAWLKDLQNYSGWISPGGETICLINSDDHTNPAVFFFSGSLMTGNSDQKYASSKLAKGDPASHALEDIVNASQNNSIGGNITQIHELNQGSWGVCTFVAFIQAAYYNKDKSVLANTNHKTMVDFLKSMNSVLQDSDCYIGTAESNWATLLPLLEKDVSMDSDLRIAGAFYNLHRIAAFAKLTGYSDFYCDAPITLESLTLSNVIYSIYRLKNFIDQDGEVFDDGHIIYVDPEGFHYSWGKKYTKEEMFDTLKGIGAAGIYGCFEFAKSDSAVLKKYVRDSAYVNLPYDLNQRDWGFDGFVAVIQAACFKLNSYHLLNAPSYRILRREVGKWLLDPGNRKFEPGIAKLASVLYNYPKENPFTFDLVLGMLYADIFQKETIGFAMTPEAMIAVAALYELDDFKLLQVVRSNNKFVLENLKYKNAIYGFGHSDLALNNGVTTWAYVDKDGNLCMHGMKIPPANIVEYLSKCVELNQISYVMCEVATANNGDDAKQQVAAKIK